MEISNSIIIPSHGPPISAAARYFKRTSHNLPHDSSGPSELLTSIKAALQGTGTEPKPPIHSVVFPSDQQSGVEEELAWNDNTVVWSTSGIQKCKYSFEEEGQSIQWVCVGWLLQPGVVHSGHSNSAARYTSDKHPEPFTSSQDSDRDTFSPFTRARQARQKISEPATVSPALFVFLRSFGKIFLVNGTEHTFSLPFIVRKAWPLFPHGVLIQRVLDVTEVEEAEITGEFTLPTLFTITNPFSEPRAVGLTEGITGGFGNFMPQVKDSDQNKPLKSVPADEHVIWVSTRLPNPSITDDIIVTIDAERRRLSVWHYVYVTPKDIPIPLGRRRARSLNRRRTSLSSGTVNEMRQPGISQSLADRAERIAPLSPDPLEATQPAEFSEMPPLSALVGMPASLSATTTLGSLATVGSMSSQWSGSVPPRGRPNSLTRNELSVTMDRMVLGRRADSDASMAPIEHWRMKAAYWVEKLFCQELSDVDSKSWTNISVSIFDERFDGAKEVSSIAVCLPSSERLVVLKMTRQQDRTLKVSLVQETPAISAVAIRATRDNVLDLLVVKPAGDLVLLTHSLHELPLELGPCDLDRMQGNSEINDLMAVDMNGDRAEASIVDPFQIVSVRDPVLNSVTLVFANGTLTRTTVALIPPDVLTNWSLQAIACTIPSTPFFALHKRFLEIWSSRNLDSSRDVEFDCFSLALFEVFAVETEPLADVASTEVATSPWQALSLSGSHSRLFDDTALLDLTLPPGPLRHPPPRQSHPPHELLAPILCALHTFGENLRLMVQHHEGLLLLAPLICRIARIVRPEWADYWKRLCPNAVAGWMSSPTVLEHIDDRISSWPPDISACLFARISSPDYHSPTIDTQNIRFTFKLSPSFAFGLTDPYVCLRQVTGFYKDLADPKVNDSRKRAENAVLHMVSADRTSDHLSLLAMGIAAPLREAARTCQLSPPPEWPVSAYEFIGRNDLSEGALAMNDTIFTDGYRSVKDHINPRRPRKTFSALFEEAHKAVHGDNESVTGVELDLENFTEIRFGQDRRLQEVARMLRSSHVPSIKMVDRPELNEHDLAKEQQNQVLRTAERTLSLPLGRAMFTFGSVPTVARELYAVPKMELSIRIQPQNTVIAAESGKIPQESLNWAEFHNGVAAGLRISPSSKAVDSSWIAFNKPHELTPEHAGFLFGLGLNGHLKEMLTWHTFSYLTPKHDLTSIGVLLGLSAANVGTGNRHVTKLLAVHTPALLPTQAVDLNVPLLTQAAGLVGIGLLYMGTKNRRMAEVALHQISRKDLLQPDLSNEHREAYTVAAALSFGMVMLGRGSVTSSPADLAILSRLRVLIHGEGPSVTHGKNSQPAFDVNLTSPAASVALGLMYLRTERQDVADILTIPDTVLGLNHMQPNFLLVRTLARSLIMWDGIKPTGEWIFRQIPSPIAKAMEKHQEGTAVDDAIELAYYHIVSGCCLAIALKYAGTAIHEAYLLIITYYDHFSRFSHANNSSFDHKIKRSAIRDGLNVISLSLNIVMAGTGEITCLRRLRYAHGMYNAPIRYGSHMATHMSLGLLFLGGGRFTLGTSDAAIACMITAFYPRFPPLSSDNRCYLQALRHLWVLAVEPRCLIARDVDTKEVVYLPMKIRVKEGSEMNGTQLISPTLIPGLDRLLSIKVDTPRYWPFFLDVANVPRHRESLLRSQTLLVKRRTAFLSYLEDPKGSRSLFVRSGTATGDAATLDFPQLTDAKAHPAGDLHQFITSFSNDIFFTAFADRLCREDGHTGAEKVFKAFCHAALLDSIIQDKPQTLQTHLLLYRARVMPTRSRYFPLVLQDLRFAAEFYSRVYERRFSGRFDQAPNVGTNVLRPPLLRESTVSGVLHAVDAKLAVLRRDERFRAALRAYARGQDVLDSAADPHAERHLAWYLLREGVPGMTWLGLVRELAREAHERGAGAPPPDGTLGLGPEPRAVLDQGVKLLLQAAGSSQAVFALGTGWSVQSLDEILQAWQEG